MRMNTKEDFMLNLKFRKDVIIKNVFFFILLLLILQFGFLFSLQAQTKSDKAKEISTTTTTPQARRPYEVGKWDTITAFTDPVVPVHMSVLPNGKVIAWGSNLGGKTGHNTIVQIWDPKSTFPQSKETIELPASFGNIFCSGHSFLPDGRLLITGGQEETKEITPVGSRKAALYDYASGDWIQLPDMNDRRWYPTNLTLGNGNILVWSGLTHNGIINNKPQILEKQFDGTFTWRTLNIENRETDNLYYSWLNLLSSGKVLATVGYQAKSYLLSIGGSFKQPRDFLYQYPVLPYDSNMSLTDPHDAGSLVVYDKDQMLVVGGADLPKWTVETIKMSDSNPQWKRVRRLKTGRRHLNTTLLPDGKILVTGGNTGNSFNNTCPQNAVKSTEMWDPNDPVGNEQTGDIYWKTLASATQNRIYHSTAVLLPDGRVLTGGTTQWGAQGNMIFPVDPNNPQSCSVGAEDNFQMEVFSPPYLFDEDGSLAERPEIANVTAQANYGQTIGFYVAGAGAGSSKVNLIRLPSVTHSFNQNQGIIKLIPTVKGNNAQITIPSNRNECPPGHYMLFFVNSEGVPSEAKIIQIL